MSFLDWASSGCRRWGPFLFPRALPALAVTPPIWTDPQGRCSPVCPVLSSAHPLTSLQISKTYAPHLRGSDDAQIRKQEWIALPQYVSGIPRKLPSYSSSPLLSRSLKITSVHLALSQISCKAAIKSCTVCICSSPSTNQHYH